MQEKKTSYGVVVPEGIDDGRSLGKHNLRFSEIGMTSEDQVSEFWERGMCGCLEGLQGFKDESTNWKPWVTYRSFTLDGFDLLEKMCTRGSLGSSMRYPLCRRDALVGRLNCRGAGANTVMLSYFILPGAVREPPLQSNAQTFIPNYTLTFNHLR